jgi:cell division protein FtsL
MTTIAAPSRRGRSKTTRAPARARRASPARAQNARTQSAHTRSEPRAATRSLAIGRLGAVLVVVTIFAVVSAVVFHVVLAQNQMELDRLNGQIAKEQRTYEHRNLAVATLGSPQHLIEAAMRQGLVEPDAPAEYLYEPGAPKPKADTGSTTDTLRDWSKTKPSLGTPPP